MDATASTAAATPPRTMLGRAYACSVTTGCRRPGCPIALVAARQRRHAAAAGVVCSIMAAPAISATVSRPTRPCPTPLACRTGYGPARTASVGRPKRPRATATRRTSRPGAFGRCRRTPVSLVAMAGGRALSSTTYRATKVRYGVPLLRKGTGVAVTVRGFRVAFMGPASARPPCISGHRVVLRCPVDPEAPVAGISRRVASYVASARNGSSTSISCVAMDGAVRSNEPDAAVTPVGASAIRTEGTCASGRRLLGVGTSAAATAVSVCRCRRIRCRPVPLPIARLGEVPVTVATRTCRS